MTLNQIRLLCPRRVTDLEVQQHLKDCLFHGVCKHRDSIRYLYSSPRTTYSQLMVATHKAESENKEACDNVRARAAMTSDCGEGATELGHQIAKLMATLTRAGQGNSLASTPKSPDRDAMGRDGWTEVLLVTPAPITVGLVWDRPYCVTANLPAVA